MSRADSFGRSSLLLLLCFSAVGMLIYQYSWMPNFDIHPSAISVPCIVYDNNSQRDKDVIETVFFSTFTIEQTGQKTYLEATKRWYDSSVAVGLKPLLFPADATNLTCEELVSFGLPCEQSLKYPYGHIRRTAARPPAVDAKPWFTLEFLKQGKRVVFSDNDVLFYSNPLELLKLTEYQGYDFLGISDTKGGKDYELATNPGTDYCTEGYGFPCVNTGLWIVHPTPTMIALFEQMNQLLMLNDIWEQELFNLLLLRHLDCAQPPKLKFLSKQHCANVYQLKGRCDGTKSYVSGAETAVHMTGARHKYELVFEYSKKERHGQTACKAYLDVGTMDVL
eukprot:m.4804 g.4804  ORF g.4804 m.4804 type:complete len:336 (-) comp7202_c0_seq1:28-1035(-)